MITCIIPAYNEQLGIEGVLKAAVGHPLLTEILVVDDGSTDNTPLILDEWKGRVRVLTHSRNKGKKDAVQTGLLHASQPYILFLDADLVNLSTKDIDRLIKPVIENRTHLTLSLRKNSTMYCPYYKLLGIDFFTGERCGKKELFSEGYTMGPNGYSIELFFNEYILENKLRFLVVSIDASGLSKPKKLGFIKGHVSQFKMMRDIFMAAKPWTFFKQSFLMPRYAHKFKLQYQQRLRDII